MPIEGQVPGHSVCQTEPKEQAHGKPLLLVVQGAASAEPADDTFIVAELGMFLRMPVKISRRLFAQVRNDECLQARKGAGARWRSISP